MLNRVGIGLPGCMETPEDGLDVVQLPGMRTLGSRQGSVLIQCRDEILDRDAESDRLLGSRLQRDNADHFTLGVEGRPTGIAVVDGRSKLKEALALELDLRA